MGICIHRDSHLSPSLIPSVPTMPESRNFTNSQLRPLQLQNTSLDLCT